MSILEVVKSYNIIYFIFAITLIWISNYFLWKRPLRIKLSRVKEVILCLAQLFACMTLMYQIWTHKSLSLLLFVMMENPVLILAFSILVSINGGKEVSEKTNISQ